MHLAMQQDKILLLMVAIQPGKRLGTKNKAIRLDIIKIIN